MKRRAALALLGLVVTLLALGGVELAARVVIPARPNEAADLEFARWSLALLDPCMTEVRRGGAPTLRETRAGARQDPSPPGEMPRARTPGVPRIAVVGESSAFMLGNSLREVLAQRPCGARHELLSCGQPGSALEHLERRFDEVLTYRPDAVVVVFGHNLQFRFSMDAWRMRLRVARAHSRALSRLGGAFDDVRNTPPPPLATRLDALDRFLLRAGEAARRAGVRLVVMTPGANLWMPPDGDLAITAPDVWREVNFREAAAGPRAALDALTAAPDRPARAFLQGGMLARAGDHAAADVALRAAMDGDDHRTRAPSAVAAHIRGAASRAGYTVRDTAAVLVSRAPGGLSGWESFSDNCHLSDARFHDEAIAVLGLALQGTPGARCAVTPPPARVDPARHLRDLVSLAPQGPETGPSQWFRALSLMLASRVSTDPDLWVPAARAYAAEVQGDPAWRLQVRLALAEGLWRANRRADAEAVNALARAGAGPGPAAAWAQRGVFRLRQGDRAGAAEDFRQAARADPTSAEARWYAARVARP
ncbi:MAG: SGNH/GDSL hydrolase family protein [Polyangiales bacterium]